MQRRHLVLDGAPEALACGERLQLQGRDAASTQEEKLKRVDALVRQIIANLKEVLRLSSRGISAQRTASV